MKAMLRLPPVAPHQCEVTVTASPLNVTVEMKSFVFLSSSPHGDTNFIQIHLRKGSSVPEFIQTGKRNLVPTELISQNINRFRVSVVAPSVMCFCDFFLVVLITSRL